MLARYRRGLQEHKALPMGIVQANMDSSLFDVGERIPSDFNHE